MAVTTVLLDLDDTLVDTYGAFSVALAEVCRHYLPHLDEAGRATAVQHWREDPGGHLDRFTAGEIGYREQRVLRAADLHAAFGGPPVDDRNFDEWNDVFERAFRSAWRALPDAEPFLRRARAGGMRILVVTNAETDYQWEKTRAAGLESFVEELIGTDVLGVGKPAPEVYREAARRAGAAPEDCAFLGDNLLNDALAPARAGMLGVWIDRFGERGSEGALGSVVGPPSERAETADPARGRGRVETVADLLAAADLLGL